MTSMTVEICGTDLPGRRCGPDLQGRMCENVHVGIKCRTDAVDLVPGDARSARWEFEVMVREDDDGGLDFRGQFVHGRRGERHLGLVWGTLAEDGTFDVFRGAKLRLADLDPSIVERALQSHGRLIARLGLTDECGYPRCASVRPPDVMWSAMAEPECGDRGR